LCFFRAEWVAAAKVATVSVCWFESAVEQFGIGVATQLTNLNAQNDLPLLKVMPGSNKQSIAFVRPRYRENEQCYAQRKEDCDLRTASHAELLAERRGRSNPAARLPWLWPARAPERNVGIYSNPALSGVSSDATGLPSKIG
jgi:hypothetical protein